MNTKKVLMIFFLVFGGIESYAQIHQEQFLWRDIPYVLKADYIKDKPNHYKVSIEYDSSGTKKSESMEFLDFKIEIALPIITNKVEKILKEVTASKDTKTNDSDNFLTNILKTQVNQFFYATLKVIEKEKSDDNAGILYFLFDVNREIVIHKFYGIRRLALAEGLIRTVKRNEVLIDNINKNLMYSETHIIKYNPLILDNTVFIPLKILIPIFKSSNNDLKKNFIKKLKEHNKSFRVKIAQSAFAIKVYKKKLNDVEILKMKLKKTEYVDNQILDSFFIKVPSAKRRLKPIIRDKLYEAQKFEAYLEYALDSLNEKKLINELTQKAKAKRDNLKNERVEKEKIYENFKFYLSEDLALLKKKKQDYEIEKQTLPNTILNKEYELLKFREQLDELRHKLKNAKQKSDINFKIDFIEYYYDNCQDSLIQYKKRLKDIDYELPKIETFIKTYHEDTLLHIIDYINLKENICELTTSKKNLQKTIQDLKEKSKRLKQNNVFQYNETMNELKKEEAKLEVSNWKYNSLKSKYNSLFPNSDTTCDYSSQKEILISYFQAQKIIEKQIQYINDSINQYEIRSKNPSKIKGLKIDRVQIEFSQGTIKNVVVEGLYKNEKIIFINLVPIPFSTLREFNYAHRLVSFGYRPIPNNYVYWIRLADVVQYVPTLYIDTDDYSPKDTTLTIQVGTDMGSGKKILGRRNIEDLFDGRIYTDAVGFNQEKPNGLVQLEVSKRIHLNAAKTPIQFLPMHQKDIKIYFSWLSHIEPYAVVAKIENKEKDLFVKKDSSNRFTPQATTLDLMQHSNFLLGTRLNILSLYLPDFKSSFHIEGGLQLNRTSILEPGATESYNLNSLVSFGEATWRIRPEEKFGATFTTRLAYFETKTNRIFNQTATFLDSTIYQRKNGDTHWTLSLQADVFLKLSQRNKLFMRGTYNTMLKSFRENFLQAQIGFSFNFVRNVPVNPYAQRYNP